MKKKVRIALCMALVVMFVLGLSSTAFAATYSSGGFTSNFISTSTVTKAAAQDVFDYNSYFRIVATNENINYKSRPCDSNGNSLAAYETNASGGSNLFTTSYTSIKIQIDNYYKRGTSCKTSGTFGGTY